jgi:hypothetical protein
VDEIQPLDSIIIGDLIGDSGIAGIIDDQRGGTYSQAYSCRSRGWRYRHPIDWS